MEFLTQVFQKTLDRKGFDCGNGALNKYIREQAGQDMDRKLSIVYAMTEGALIKGYYSLSNYSQPTEFFPPEIQKRFPPTHTHIPTTLLGRLAIDNQFQGQGLGSQLLMDAMKRALLASKVIASTALVVDPIDQVATDFYARFGFIQVPSTGKMFIAMRTIEGLF